MAQRGVNLDNRVIIVAEDDKEIRELLAAALSTELGMHVMLVADGKRLLELAKQVRPTLVVTDIRMPVLDGLEAIRRLHADGATTHVPVIAISAAAARAEALEAGCWAFVPKPFVVDDLVEMVGDVLKASGANGSTSR